jgi:hypothetical protein
MLSRLYINLLFLATVVFNVIPLVSIQTYATSRKLSSLIIICISYIFLNIVYFTLLTNKQNLNMVVDIAKIGTILSILVYSILFLNKKPTFLLLLGIVFAIIAIICFVLSE